MVVDPQKDEWYTVGDNGPEMTPLPDNAIVFNHLQTEDLLIKGHTTNRGRALARGNAAVRKTTTTGGKLNFNEEPLKSSAKSSSDKGTKGNTGNKGGTDTSKAAEETKETFDWIEVAIKRIESAIQSLQELATNVYDTFSSRNKNLTKEINKINKEIEKQTAGANKYEKKADSIDLSKNLKEKVRNGAIDIKDYDQETAKKIKEYQQWYVKCPSIW